MIPCLFGIIISLILFLFSIALMVQTYLKLDRVDLAKYVICFLFFLCTKSQVTCCHTITNVAMNDFRN